MNIFVGVILTNYGGAALLFLPCTLVDSSKIWMTCWRCCTGFCSLIICNQQSPSVHRKNKHWNSNIVQIPKEQYEVVDGKVVDGKGTLVFSRYSLGHINPLEKLRPAIGSLLWIWVYQLNHQILRFNWNWAIVMHHTFLLVCQSLKMNSFSSPRKLSFHRLYQYPWASKMLDGKPSEETFFVESLHTSKEMQTFKSQKIVIFLY